MATFEAQVFEVVRRVPAGRVTTYGTIARLLGQPRTARRVGWALHRCPDDVPAHRVVGADGRLSGGWAFGAPAIQRALLEAEGVGFLGSERCDLAAHRWPTNV
ncbi:MAG: MGMT family protein [Chloroflexota bacterium]|nr:MGMT family protein [Chloroflexota bacterium]